MTTGTLILGGVIVALLIVVAGLAAMLYTTWRDLGTLAHYRDRVPELREEQARLAGELDAERRENGRLLELIHVQHEELLELKAGPLVGRLVSVNTPNPDDQSIKGVCARQLADGGLVLEAAVYMDTVRGRDQVVEVVERPIGTAIVRAYSWAQVLEADGSPGERVESDVAPTPQEA